MEEEGRRRPVWLTVLCFVLGLAAVAGAGWAVGWNERKAVLQDRRQVLGSGVVLEVDPQQVDPAAEGRLVHAMGMLVVPGTRFDRDFGIGAPGAVRLDRTVEMFQWARGESGGYEQVWSTVRIDSAGFAAGHANPSFSKGAFSVVAPRGVLGGLTLSYDSLQQLAPLVPIPLSNAPAGSTVTPEGLFVGADPARPAVGDMRVPYTAVQGGEVSVLGLLSQGTVRPYRLDGLDILVARAGRVSAAELGPSGPPVPAGPLWAVRGATAAGLLVGFWLLTQPAGALGAAIERRRPLLGEVVATGPFLIALACAVFSWALLAGVIWVRYRVLWGVGILVGGALLAAWMGWIIRGRWVWLQPVEYAPTRVRES